MQAVSRISLLAIGLVFVWMMGCSPPASPPPAATNSTSSPEGHGHDHPHEHGHDHAHGHSHADHGPNGGHILELGNEEYHAEWIHDNESGKLTVVILDASAKELVPIPAASIKIEKKIGENTQSYDLVAVDPQGDPAKSAKFEITDKPLVEALKSAGTGVEATLTVDIGGKNFSAKIEHHDH